MPDTPTNLTAQAVADVFARVRCGYPLLALDTPEERRWVDALSAAADAEGYSVTTWSAADKGFNMVGHLRALRDDPPSRTLVLLFDAGPYLTNPTRARLLREALPGLAERQSAALLIAHRTPLPSSLESDAATVDLPQPGSEELTEDLRAAAAAAGRDAPDEALTTRLVNAARGLTRESARRAFTLALSDSAGGDDPLAAVVNEKRRLVSGGDLLEFRGLDESADAVGGLQNLKEWLAKRAAAFSPEAAARGVPAPRGVLLLGVQGCGKSLTARVAARILGFPLVRLDVAALLASEQGESEKNLRRALASVAAIAPAVLWLDELEKGFAGAVGEGGASEAAVRRMTGTLLTWMEDRPAPVFVAATANSVDALPPELLRRGRFDELFFIDLPNEYERRDILRVHLTRGGQDPTGFDVEELAEAAEGHSGAELAQAVTTALIDAHTDGRTPTQADLKRAIEETVPLSVTMEDQIFALREWCRTRTRPATPDSRVLRMMDQERRRGGDAEGEAGPDGPAWGRLAAGGQTRAAITEFLAAKDGATFPTLCEALAPYAPVAGPLALALKAHPTSVVWAGLDETFAAEIARLVENRRVYLHPADADDHPPGTAPKLPIFQDDGDEATPPDGPHWRPVVLKTLPRPGAPAEFARLTRVRLAKK
ncbi:AAA family ATPase [Alienimonas sp. DA493]|uniref:AAA family ATPase n=1 Tax=Alienimonas sp. DA493 TaxID=3373605 RepID=UPI00375471C8